MMCMPRCNCYWKKVNRKNAMTKTEEIIERFSHLLEDETPVYHLSPSELEDGPADDHGHLHHLAVMQGYDNIAEGMDDLVEWTASWVTPIQVAAIHWLPQVVNDAGLYVVCTKAGHGVITASRIMNYNVKVEPCHVFRGPISKAYKHFSTEKCWDLNEPILRDVLRCHLNGEVEVKPGPVSIDLDGYTLTYTDSWSPYSIRKVVDSLADQARELFLVNIRSFLAIDDQNAVIE